MRSRGNTGPQPHPWKWVWDLHTAVLHVWVRGQHLNIGPSLGCSCSMWGGVWQYVPWVCRTLEEPRAEVQCVASSEYPKATPAGQGEGTGVPTIPGLWDLERWEGRQGLAGSLFFPLPFSQAVKAPAPSQGRVHSVW